jgi:hypothetical protein
MNLTETLAVFTCGFAMMAIALWRETRSRKHLHPPLVPNRPLLFIGTIIIVLSGVHLLTFLRVR